MTTDSGQSDMMERATTFSRLFLTSGTIPNGYGISLRRISPHLESYFKITDVNQAIYDTIEDSEELECLILDISPDANLDLLFRPLENNRTAEMMLGKEKARLYNREEHASWLRLYAIKLEQGHYIITGGAIKLTRTMQERDHTLQELAKMEQVRNLLIEDGVVDAEGFEDYTNEL